MNVISVDQVSRLYGLGFAILWLRPRSKAPVESGWTQGPKTDWESLRKKFRIDYNVGVRLGRASTFKDGKVLAVLDCDLKSSDPKDRDAMESHLERILATMGVTGKTSVVSGRANGSKHIYLRVNAGTPELKLGESANFAKVKMPSADRVSKREIELLTPDEIKDGIRIRRAWEIVLMGEGRQVVLPPSIHPDTGAIYDWESFQEPTNWEDIESADLSSLKAIAQKSAENKPKREAVQFKLVDIDLDNVAIDPKIKAMIVDGDDAPDRSAALFTASLALVKAGLNNNEILSLLTDRTYFLGETGFDHAKTESRSVAAQWVYRYSLAKARAEVDANLDFAQACEVRTLSSTEIDEQLKEIKGLDTRNWVDRLERSGRAGEGAVKNTALNLRMVLTNAVAADTFSYNEFTNREFYGVDTPWGGRAGREIVNEDIVAIKVWCRKAWGFEPAANVVIESVSFVCRTHRVHPVRNWLNGLKWDGVARCDDWLTNYLGAEGPKEYVKAVASKMLIAMVARVFNPGVKFDQVVILEGYQGLGKSSALRVLAGEWFSDGTINFHDKDAVLQIAGKWLIELGELSGLNRSDVETIKAFVSRQVDRVRLPYEAKSEDFPRQCVMVGSTNANDYLKDETGGRRFWPVKVTTYNAAGLSSVRDQLFAEALTRFKSGEPLWFDKKMVADQAIVEQAGRLEHDVLGEVLQEFLDDCALGAPDSSFNPNRFSLMELKKALTFSESEIVKSLNNDVQTQKRISRQLRILGFEPFKTTKTRFWVRK